MKDALKDKQDTKAAAEYLGYAAGTLRKWRQHRKGPAYIKTGKGVRYKIVDLIEFEKRHRIDPSYEQYKEV